MTRIRFQLRPLIVFGIVTASIAIVAVFGSAVLTSSKSSDTVRDDFHRIRIGEAEISVEYALTNEERERGLSGRNSLEPHEGLLFFFPESALYGFWMKDMLFDVDIVWIRDSRVIGLTERVSAPKGSEDPLLTHYPPSAADMVLEVSAGVARELGIDTGDVVSFLE